MILRTYLFNRDLPVKKFAAELGISVSYLYQLLKNERKASLELALKVERITKGNVSVDELLKEEKNNSSDGLNASEKVIESKLKAIENLVKDLDQRVKTLEGAMEFHSA